MRTPPVHRAAARATRAPSPPAPSPVTHREARHRHLGIKVPGRRSGGHDHSLGMSHQPGGAAPAAARPRDTGGVAGRRWAAQNEEGSTLPPPQHTRVARVASSSLHASAPPPHPPSSQPCWASPPPQAEPQGVKRPEQPAAHSDGLQAHSERAAGAGRLGTTGQETAGGQGARAARGARRPPARRLLMGGDRCPRRAPRPPPPHATGYACPWCCRTCKRTRPPRAALARQAMICFTGR